MSDPSRARRRGGLGALLFLPLLLLSACVREAPGEPVSLDPASVASTAAVAEPAQAEQLLREALAATPDQPQLLAQLGSVLLRQNRVDEAAETLQRAVDLGNADPDVLLNLGAARYQQGDVDAAIAAFERARAAAPDDPDLLYNLGSAYAQKGDNDQAIALYQQVIAADGNLPLPWFGLATIYYGQQEREAAIDALNRFLELSQEPELRGRAEEMLADLQATP